MRKRLTNASYYSEFPSLSSTSQPQYQNTSQAVWANQRTVQQTPVQRPQQHQQQTTITSPTPQQHLQNQQPQRQSQRASEDAYSPPSHLQSAMEDSRYQSALGQMPNTRQSQTTNVDDFPPLGRNGVEDNDDRRRNMVQGSIFDTFSGSTAFSLPSDQSQPRNNIASASNSQANNTRSSSAIDRLTSPNGVAYGGKCPSIILSMEVMELI